MFKMNPTIPVEQDRLADRPSVTFHCACEARAHIVNAAALDSDRHGRGFSHSFLGPKIAAFRTGLSHEAIFRRYAFSEDG